nr:hypothetical protein [Tanacetum cinerariifolium]
MARLEFCDYHNMIAILEKYEHNIDFHQIVDFVEASHIRYALTINPTVYVSHIRQFWSTARVETSDKGTKILATVDADEPASPLGDDSQGEACPTVSSLEAKQDRATIIKSSTLPYDSTPRVTSLAADEGSMQHKLNELTDLIKMLEDKDKGVAEPYGEDATIKGKSLGTGEEVVVKKSTERGSNDTEELVNVLTSLDAASNLTSRVQVVSISPAAEVATVSVPNGSGMVPTASPIFTTASVVTLYLRRKGKEKMVESDTPKKKRSQGQIDVQVAREMEEQIAREDQRMNEQIARDAEIARIHAEEELQMLIDSLDRTNETIAKYLREYEQFAADLSIEERIEMINDLVKYQDNYAKVLKYQSQQRKPISKKQKREFLMSVLKSHSGWKTNHFKGMSLEEIREKFIPVWKQIEDFVPIGSKEEGERVKRKGLRLEQESAKKEKTSEEVLEEDFKTMIQLVPVEEVYVEALQVKDLIIDWEIYTERQRTYWKIIRLGGNTTVYQFFVDMLKHFDREDLNQLWTLVKETLSIRQATSIPTASDEFPLPEDFPTASEERFPLLRTVMLRKCPMIVPVVDPISREQQDGFIKWNMALLSMRAGRYWKKTGIKISIQGSAGLLGAKIGEETAIEKSTERGSNDTKELVNILTSLDAASMLTSRVQVVSIPPAAEVTTEYEQFAADLSIEEMIELINDLGMSLEEIREKFILVWKQIEDFVYMGSKEEGERVKRKGLRLEPESAKKVKTSKEVSKEDLKTMMQLVPVEEVYVEALQVKHLIIDWEIHIEGQRTYWKIIRLGENIAVYQFFVDMLKHFDREDHNQMWTLIKETLSIRQDTSDKEKELWVELKRLYEPDVEDQLCTHTQALMHDQVEWRLYDSCGVHHVLSRDQEIFMLAERDYPLRKRLAIVMISNKLQVENYSQMANDLILKIYKIANSPRQRDD